MSLWEFRVDLLPGDVERVDEALAELESSNWNIVEEALEKRAQLIGFFSGQQEGVMAWRELQPILPARVARREPEVRPVEEREWQEAYKAHFHRWQFNDLHWAPIWEKETFSPPEGEQVVWLDPGMAFGTGNHETTRLCVERLVTFRDQCREEGRDPAKLSVLDAGCGSGILALSALKCGFGQVAGFDNDPAAVAISEENAELNDLAGCVTFFQSELTAGLAGRTDDLVIANIQADILAAHASGLTAAVREKGSLILSGILERECEQLRERFRQARAPRTDSRFTMGEWCAVEFHY